MLDSSLAPLAARMRPSRLDDLVGQEHLVGAERNYSSGYCFRKHPFYDFVGTARGR